MSVNQDKDVQIEMAELRQAVTRDIEKMLGDTLDAVNNARDGAIIANSEWLVRDAMARFRQTVYEKVIQLKADKAAGAAFSPSTRRQRNAASE